MHTPANGSKRARHGAGWRSRARWLVLLLPLAALLVHAAALGPLAPRLAGSGSVRVLDRFGQLLAEVRDARSELALPVRLDELSPWVEPALLAAEDARFYRHPGVDPLAMLRAAGQALASGRVVSGGSTLTQQLARTLFDRPRTLLGKWREIAHALRLEAELDKRSILEAYLNRVYFGPQLRGLGAAARHYFDKPPSALSLAEAAALVACVQAPSRFDPERFPERLERRRNKLLDRLLALGWADRESVLVARRTPLTLHRGLVVPGAFHFVRAAVTGKLGAAGGAGAPATSSPADRATTLPTTLDAALEREVERLVQSFGARFAEHRASAAAVLVVENRSGAVRAYLGSPDPRSTTALGQNDGVLALRQPGSTLKPFVYALGLADLGLNSASLLTDLERRFSSAEGEYLPYNYDRRFHGPVRLAQALAASLNVPAVALAERIGSERVLELLRGIGFSHLMASGAHYGPAIALGVSEVQLAELAGAYATLGRGGVYLPLRYFADAAPAEPRRVLSEAVSREILGILSDPRERAATFGRDGPLEFDVPVAVKTGTSKGNRDNWVVGVGAGLTAAVWVGNFDGSPMLRSSGASGAGPLFHGVMEAALRRAPALPPPLSLPLESPAGAETSRVVVCALSGLLAGPDCPHRLELSGPLVNAPHDVCRWHRPGCAATSSATGPSDGCDPERIPERYAAWAHDSGRAAPSGVVGASRPRRTGVSPAHHAPDPSVPLRVVFPRSEQRFALDARVSASQAELVLRAEADAGARVIFEVDGERACDKGLPFACPWPLRRGRHRLVVRAGSEHSAPVTFSVD